MKITSMLKLINFFPENKLHKKNTDILLDDQYEIFYLNLSDFTKND